MADAPRPAPLEPVEGSPPDFIAELVDEVRAFFRVLDQFTRHPILFTREWSEGKRRAMNPVGFFGAAVGAQLAVAAVVGHYRPDLNQQAAAKLSPELAWLLELLASQLPLAKAAIFAAAVHWRLKKKGSTQTFRGSLGAVLYAEGWEAVGNALAASLALVAGAHVGEAVSSVLSIAALVMLALALAGVHRLTRWRSALGPMILGGLAVALAASVAASALWVPRALAALKSDPDVAAFLAGKDGVDVKEKEKAKAKTSEESRKEGTQEKN